MQSAAMATTAILVRSWDRAHRLEAGLAGRGYEDSLRTLEPSRLRSTRFLLTSLALVSGIVLVSLLWTVLA